MAKLQWQSHSAVDCRGSQKGKFQMRFPHWIQHSKFDSVVFAEAKEHSVDSLSDTHSDSADYWRYVLNPTAGHAGRSGKSALGGDRLRNFGKCTFREHVVAASPKLKARLATEIEC